jgi:transposase
VRNFALLQGIMMENRKRVTVEEKKEIWNLYQQGLVSREIAKKVGCSFVTVCHWIHRLIASGACGGVVLPKGPSTKRRTPLNTKPHCSHRPHQYRPKCKLTVKEKENLRSKIVEMYQKYESAPKVADELRKEGIHLSSPTILKRVRETFNQIQI